jgi:hypothetical protein
MAHYQVPWLGIRSKISDMRMVFHPSGLIVMDRLRALLYKLVVSGSESETRALVINAEDSFAGRVSLFGPNRLAISNDAVYITENRKICEISLDNDSQAIVHPFAYHVEGLCVDAHDNIHVSPRPSYYSSVEPLIITSENPRIMVSSNGYLIAFDSKNQLVEYTNDFVRWPSTGFKIDFCEHYLSGRILDLQFDARNNAYILFEPGNRLVVLSDTGMHLGAIEFPNDYSYMVLGRTSMFMNMTNLVYRSIAIDRNSNVLYAHHKELCVIASVRTFDYDRWTTQSHCYFHQKFRDVVMALMMVRNVQNSPYHDTPLEMMFHIIELMSLDHARYVENFGDGLRRGELLHRMSQ